MADAFGLRKGTSTLRGADSLRWATSSPLVYQLNIFNESAPPSETFPTMLIQAAFDSDPLDNVPQWTDITRYCQAVTFTRGRSFELDEVQAGTATFTFKNTDRALDPTNEAGPFFGQLTTRRRIRCSAIWGGVTYSRFDGFVDSWPQTADDPSQSVAFVEVTATDPFLWLSKNNLRTVTPLVTNHPVFGKLDDSWRIAGQITFKHDESCQSRIDKILDLWPFPPNMRRIDTGLTFLAKDSPDASETSLNYIQRIATSETGRFYWSRNGKLAFEARNHWQSDPQQSSAQMILSDQGPLSYSAIQVDPADERYIRNRIVRGRENFAAPVVAVDATSVAIHGLLEDSHTDCLSRYTLDMQNQVAWLLAKYANPKPRFSSVTLMPQRSPAAMFPKVLASELGNMINLSYTQTKTGAPMVGDYWIEQITETITVSPQAYTVQYGLAPADTDTY